MKLNILYVVYQRSARTDDKSTRTSVGGGGTTFSSAESSPYYRPMTSPARPGLGAAALQSRPSVASGGGCAGNLSGSFPSGVMVLPRAESGAAFHAVFHGVDPDVTSSPPPSDDAAGCTAEKLGCIQFKLSYDFQVPKTCFILLQYAGSCFVEKKFIFILIHFS